MEAQLGSAPAPAPDCDILAHLRYVRRLIDRAGQALDEVRAAAQARTLPNVVVMADLQAWECHLLYVRASLLSQIADHDITGRPIPPYDVVSSWLR